MTTAYMSATNVKAYENWGPAGVNRFAIDFINTYKIFDAIVKEIPNYYAAGIVLENNKTK